MTSMYLINVYKMGSYGNFSQNADPPSPLQEFWPDSTRFFCPCQLGSTVEIRLWEWYELLNKNFYVYLFFIQIQPQTRFFSCVVELFEREHEIITLAAFF